MERYSGYIYFHRRAFAGWLADAPPLTWKLFLWLLTEARWKDGDRLKRGQLFTTIKDMQDALSWKIGYRTQRPTRDQVRSSYEALTKATVITTAKTTRGMIITILNYNKYQDPKNNEAHTEAHSENQRSPSTPHTILEEGKKEKEGKNKGTPLTPQRGDEGEALENFPVEEPKKKGVVAPTAYPPDFEAFWGICMPKKGSKKKALEKWEALDLNTKRAAYQAMANQIRVGQFRNRQGVDYPPHVVTWLTQQRWEDDLEPWEAQRPILQVNTISDAMAMERDEAAMRLQAKRQGGDPYGNQPGVFAGADGHAADSLPEHQALETPASGTDKPLD